MQAKITGLGHHVPSLAISNDDLSKIIDTSDEWIHSRTGIRNRYIAKDSTTYEMAAEAGKKALEQAGVKAEDVALIIVATFTADYATPSMACLVQKILGAHEAMCFDLNAACSGFVYSLDVADQFLQNGKVKNALVIGSEKISQILNWEDRGTCVLFGDGAGAALLTASEDAGIIDTVNKAIGQDYACLTTKNKVNNTPYYEGSDGEDLRMNGQEVFQFACTKVPEIIREVLAKNGQTLEDVDIFVLHQANARIVSKIAKRLKVDQSKFYMNMDTYGNTSAASIPIALSELSKAGILKGKTVVTAGFGAGLTYGASLIKF